MNDHPLEFQNSHISAKFNDHLPCWNYFKSKQRTFLFKSKIFGGQSEKTYMFETQSEKCRIGNNEMRK